MELAFHHSPEKELHSYNKNRGPSSSSLFIPGPCPLDAGRYSGNDRRFHAPGIPSDRGTTRTLHPWDTLIIPFRHAKYINITLIPIGKNHRNDSRFIPVYEKNLSEKTLKAYATDLGQFADFMINQRSICHLPAISAEDLKQYVKSLSAISAQNHEKKNGYAQSHAELH